MEKYSKRALKLSKQVKHVVNVKKYVRNTPLYKASIEDKKYFPKYKIFNERFVVNQKNHPLEYEQFERISKLSNRLFNSANSIQRERFLSGQDILCYQDLKQFFEFEEHDNGSAIVDYIGMPRCARLGTLYSLSDKWFRFLSDLGAQFSKGLKMPRNHNGRNRKYSFTINPSNVKISRNNYKNGRFKCTMTLPKELNIGEYQLHIPTNIASKTSISEIRITPNRGLFLVDIKYTVAYNDNPKDYIEYENRYAGIDIGLKNTIALASNVGTKPVIIKGDRLIAKNAYYNRLMSKTQVGSRRWNRLNRNRIGFIDNYFNRCAKIVVDCLDVAGIKKLIIGKSKYISTGFMKKCGSFQPINFTKLIDKIKKLCKKSNIRVTLTDERYTSTTSALDLQSITGRNHNPSRRSGRIYTTDRFGKVDSDVNSAFNMIKKISPNALDRVLAIVLTHKWCRLKGRVVTPVVVGDPVEKSSTGTVRSLWVKSELFIQQRTARQNRATQYAKPFSDYWTRKFELDRVNFLIRK